MTSQKHNNQNDNKLFYFIFKRVFDIIVSFIGCIILIPIIVIIKIVTMLSGDMNSIFFIQKRIGKYGKEFKFYKFRTMIPNADEELEKILKQSKELAAEYKKNKKLKNDPRITKLGKLLRKLSIDEFPQMINVLKGEMAMIGNRPYLPREKKDMGKYFENIVKTKPGLTGYWQVSGRNNKSFEDRLKLENYYSSNYSLWLDIKIFFKTFKVVILGKGAE